MSSFDFHEKVWEKQTGYLNKVEIPNLSYNQYICTVIWLGYAFHNFMHAG